MATKKRKRQTGPRRAAARGRRGKATQRRKPTTRKKPASRTRPRSPAAPPRRRGPRASRSTATARTYVGEARLPEPPARRRGPTDAAQLVFDRARDQATVVGSNVISFVSGVTAEHRQDIVNSSLFAQLVAKQQVGDAEDVKRWYDAYFDALTRIGWVIQEKTFARYAEKSADFSAHEAIAQVAAVLLGPAAVAALTVVQTTLSALRSMGSDAPWITLYDHQSRTGKTAHFQATLVSEEAGGMFLVALMAFSLEATAALDQVLFFRVRTNEASLQHCSGKVTIDTDVLDAIRPTLKARLAAWATSYVKEVPLPPGP